MPTDRFFGDDIATFKVEIASTTLTAGKVKDVTITAVADHVKLFAPDDSSSSDTTVTRDEVKRREVEIEVEFTIVQFNEELAQYWLNGGGSTSTTINDTTDVAEYDVTLEQNMTDHDGSTDDESLKAVVDNVEFSEMPLLDLAEGEYNEHQLSGTGDGVTFTKQTVS
jgi:hypothetical protein